MELYYSIRIGVLIRIVTLFGIGALINKNTFEGGALIQKGALIGRRVPNRIITVVNSHLIKEITNPFGDHKNDHDRNTKADISSGLH